MSKDQHIKIEETIIQEEGVDVVSCSKNEFPPYCSLRVNGLKKKEFFLGFSLKQTYSVCGRSCEKQYIVRSNIIETNILPGEPKGIVMDTLPETITTGEIIKFKCYIADSFGNHITDLADIGLLNGEILSLPSNERKVVGFDRERDGSYVLQSGFRSPGGYQMDIRYRGRDYSIKSFTTTFTVEEKKNSASNIKLVVQPSIIAGSVPNCTASVLAEGGLKLSVKPIVSIVNIETGEEYSNTDEIEKAGIYSITAKVSEEYSSNGQEIKRSKQFEVVNTFPEHVSLQPEVNRQTVLTQGNWLWEGNLEVTITDRFGNPCTTSAYQLKVKLFDDRNRELKQEIYRINNAKALIPSSDYKGKVSVQSGKITFYHGDISMEEIFFTFTVDINILMKQREELENANHRIIREISVLEDLISEKCPQEEVDRIEKRKALLSQQALKQTMDTLNTFTPDPILSKDFKNLQSTDLYNRHKEYIPGNVSSLGYIEKKEHKEKGITIDQINKINIGITKFIGESSLRSIYIHCDDPAKKKMIIDHFTRTGKKLNLNISQNNVRKPRFEEIKDEGFLGYACDFIITEYPGLFYQLLGNTMVFKSTSDLTSYCAKRNNFSLRAFSLDGDQQRGNQLSIGIANNRMELGRIGFASPPRQESERSIQEEINACSNFLRQRRDLEDKIKSKQMELDKILNNLDTLNATINSSEDLPASLGKRTQNRYGSTPNPKRAKSEYPGIL